MQVQDTDIMYKDQALKENAEALLAKANGKQMDDAFTKAAQLASKRGKSAASTSTSISGTASAGQSDARVLAIGYIALAAAVVAFIGSVGPMVAPDLYERDTTGIADALEEWSPLPQAGLAALVLALLAAVVILRGKRSPASQTGTCWLYSPTIILKYIYPHCSHKAHGATINLYEACWVPNCKVVVVLRGPGVVTGSTMVHCGGLHCGQTHTV